MAAKQEDFWQVRKKVVGDKRGPMLATAVRNPETKQLATSNKEVKRITLNYCIETLSNNKPEKEFEGIINDKKALVKEMMEKKDGEFESSMETFKKNIGKFRRSGKQTYDLRQGRSNKNCALTKSHSSDKNDW